VTAFDDVFSDPAIRRGSGRPKQYRTEDGKRLPSVTTITNRFKDSGGLIHWANEVGLAGMTTDEARAKALNTGSLVHRIIEADIHGDARPPVPDELLPGVVSAIGAWTKWLRSYEVRVEATELPLQSKTHMFAGTLDLVIRDAEDRLAIGDIKAANGIYPEYLMQIAAYGLLWDENEEEKITGGFHLLRFSKEDGDFTHHFFPELADAKKAFLLLRAAYEMDKALKRRAK